MFPVALPATALLLAIRLAGQPALPPAVDLAGQPAAPPAVDLAGRAVDPLRDAGARPAVLIFVGVDCPISNRYAPEIERLAAAWAPRGAAFWLVYPDAAASADAIGRHRRDHGSTLPALRDPAGTLAAHARVTVTPEAAVFVRGRAIYRGRIDDRYVELGRARPQARSRDLARAIEAALAGRPAPVASAPAVGCQIPAR